MRVIATQDGVLSNLEVRELLQARVKLRQSTERRRSLTGARRGASPASWRHMQDAVVITDQVMRYLDERPCAKQTRANIRAFTDAVAPFQLTRAEVLSLVNTQPRSLVEIHLIVEECDERLSAEQTQELLDLCAGLSATDPPAVRAKEVAKR